MRTWFRIFFIGGVIAYRGLFNWIAPAYYIPTMLLGPIFQILFFAYLGRYSHAGSDTFFVVGNGVQVAAMAGVFGMALTIGGKVMRGISLVASTVPWVGQSPVRVSDSVAMTILLCIDASLVSARGATS